jgi:hypothetical protein
MLLGGCADPVSPRPWGSASYPGWGGGYVDAPVLYDRWGGYGYRPRDDRRDDRPRYSAPRRVEPAQPRPAPQQESGKRRQRDEFIRSGGG